MMASLLKYQDSDGVWHQLIDHPESYQESSSTPCRLCHDHGREEGLAERTSYAQSPRKAWIGPQQVVHRQGRPGGQGLRRHRPDNSLEFYLNRPTRRAIRTARRPSSGCINALLKK